VVDPLKLGMELARLAVDLFDGRETPEGARVRVKDILPEKSESEKAAEDIIAARRLEALGELDDVDSLHPDEDEITHPGGR
jgi:hypothetical protein